MLAAETRGQVAAAASVADADAASSDGNGQGSSGGTAPVYPSF